MAFLAETPPPRDEAIESIIVFLVVLFIVIGQRERIFAFITKAHTLYLQSHVALLLVIFGLLLKFLSVAFIAGIIFLLFKLRGISSAQWALYKPIPVERATEVEHKTQWEVILDHVGSDNPAEWKLAIIEADNILDELLKEIGYGGETLGDRLKSIDTDNLSTLSGAWDAHKLRNAIAHEQGFELTRREAKKAIKLYEETFRELGYFGTA